MGQVSANDIQSLIALSRAALVAGLLCGLCLSGGCGPGDRAAGSATWLQGTVALEPVTQSITIRESERRAVTATMASAQFRDPGTLPLVDYDTPHHRIEVLLDVAFSTATLRVDGKHEIPFDWFGVPLRILEPSRDRLLVFYRSIPANRLTLVDLDLKTDGLVRYDLDQGQPAFIDFREAILDHDLLVCVFYDNVAMANYVATFPLSAPLSPIPAARITLPSIEDPAGRNYEIKPDIHLVSFGDAVYVLGGQRCFLFRPGFGSLVTLPRIAGCLRFVEAAAAPDGVYAVYQEEDSSKVNPYGIVNLTTQQPYPYDRSRGIPFNLHVEDGQIAFDRVRRAQDLAELFLFDFLRSKASGALYLGANNLEGSVPWSQVYYLNGLIDFVVLARRSSRISSAFHDLAGEIRRRLDVEMMLLDRLIGSEPSVDTLAFTVARVPALFAVQTSRILLLMHRYANEVPNPVPLGHYSQLKQKVFSLDGHIEVLATVGEAERWLKPGRYHLRWPKGCAFPYDGTPVPYNHQNEWASAILTTTEGGASDTLAVTAAADILSQFVERVAPNGEFPDSFEWPYWWGIAYDGWTEKDGVSENKPSYLGDKGLAWISFRSIDVMAVLSTLEELPQLEGPAFLRYVVRAVSRGKLFPFVAESLLLQDVSPDINPAIANRYLRLCAPQELQSCVWAYLYYLLPG